MRRVLRLLPVVAVAALVAACVPTKPPAPDPCQGPDVTVTAGNLCGWTNETDGTAVDQFAAGPGTPPAGAGSYQFASGDDDDAGGAASISSPVFVAPLADITTLNYSTLVVDYAGGSVADNDDAPHLTGYLTLTVDTDGNLTTSTDLAQVIFEPCYSDPTDCVDATQALDTWSGWETIGTDKVWWLDAPGNLCGSVPVNEFENLDDLILTGCPDAIVLQITLSGGQSGGGAPWLSFAGAVDQLVLATGGPETTFDFEA